MIAGFKYHMKQIVRANVLTALLVYALAPLFFYIKTLDFQMYTRMGEMYLSIAGIFLFTPLSCCEEKYGCADVVYLTKKFFPGFYLERLVILILLSGMMEFGFLSVVWLANPILTFGQAFFGLWASQLFLGLLSMAAAEFSGDMKVGYIVGFIWYLLDLMTKGALFGPVTAVGYYAGRANFKWCLVIVCVCLISYLLYQAGRKNRGQYEYHN